MKFVTLSCLMVFALLLTSCKTDHKKVSDDEVALEANEVDDDLNMDDIDEDEDYTDLIENAIMALEGNDVQLAVLNLNKASDYFKPENVDNDEDKENEKLAATIQMLALAVEKGKITTSDALLTAIKGIDGLKEIFDEDMEEVDIEE